MLTRQNGKPVREFRDDWYDVCIAASLGKWVCGNCGKNVLDTKKKCKCGSRQRKYACESSTISVDRRRRRRGAGVPESVIMNTGGWKTPAMFGRYAIVSSEDQRDAMEKLEAMLEQE